MTDDVYGVSGTNLGTINQNFSQTILIQSPDYKDLMERIAEKPELVESRQASGQTDRALKAAAELEKLEQQLEQLKENVLRLSIPSPN